MNEQELLLEWYERCGRKELPWRNLMGDQASYGVYVSEVMLQQTRVSAVLEYFDAFMRAYPTLHSLSLASQDAVLLLWQGLGYYSRAKNLLKTAKMTGTKLPSDLDSLLALPGIGDYTARAILCFGFGQAVGFYDTNIKRFFCRYFALTAPSHKTLHRIAQDFLNLKNPFDHNQALLDLGALVCLPKNPHCKICPLHLTCKGRHHPSLYSAGKKVMYTPLTLHLGVYEEGGCVAMFRDQKWNGLYSFPEILPESGRWIGEVKHTRTHYKITAKIYRLYSLPKQAGIELLEDRERFPMSSLSRKILEKLKQCPS
ncbi:A/G-specific adenine glycosylase [Helicobacter mustelae]|uniref:A/G-specific adenine glycosylase n=1 Tax=Helicobacter mustelae TaxID=217 RepID=UPI000E011407|nr:A/G-specific adenine glycosylase [Helicobacter mustelae]STP12187.1 A/G-specific adenine glycosylase [Helicobacter mustelae]